LEKKDPITTLKTLVAGSIPFKTESILTGNNVVDTSASNTGGFLWRVTCVSSI
jgi:hypothetical protein